MKRFDYKNKFGLIEVKAMVKASDAEILLKALQRINRTAKTPMALKIIAREAIRKVNEKFYLVIY